MCLIVSAPRYTRVMMSPHHRMYIIRDDDGSRFFSVVPATTTTRLFFVKTRKFSSAALFKNFFFLHQRPLYSYTHGCKVASLTSRTSGLNFFYSRVLHDFSLLRI